MWFKKPYKNVVELSQAKVDELLANLDKLKDYGGDLFDRVVRYLLDGENEAVLGELGGKADAAACVRLLEATHHGVGRTSPWRAFLCPIQPVDCRFYLRLGKMLEAASSSLPRTPYLCQQPLSGGRWLEVLLQESTNTSNNYWTSTPPSSPLTATMIDDMFKAEECPIESFITAAFRPGRHKWESEMTRNLLLSVQEIGTYYALHYSLVSPFLREGAAASRQLAVENLTRSCTPAKPFIAELVECATDASKLLREAAEPLVKTELEAAFPLIERAARDPKAAKREQGIRLLARLYGSDARPLLEEIQTNEKNATIREVIANALCEFQGHSASPQAAVALPPHTPIDLHPRLTPSLCVCIERLLADYNRYAAEHNQKLASRTQNQFVYPNHPLATIATGQRDVDGIVRMLEEGGDIHGTVLKSFAEVRNIFADKSRVFKAFLEHPDLHLIHLVRLLVMTKLLDPQSQHWGGINSHTSALIDSYRRTHEPKITLLHVAEAINAVGMHDDIVVDHMLESYFPAFRWEPEAVWPFLVGKTDILEEAFKPSDGNWNSRWRRKQEFDNALRILAAFPQVPPSLVGRLWEMAIGTGKADRLRAQKIVVVLPDLSDRLLQALSARSADTRAIAAEWMGRLGDARHIAPLHKAAKAEKIDATIDEMLSALERLGEDVEPYLDRNKLLADAERGLKKGIPAALGWFPWDQLPVVHWQDSNQPVPREVLTWLLVQSFRFKSAEAGPLLRRYCAMLRPADRAELGQFVLRAWLDQDLKRKLTDAECRAKAQQQAPVQWQQFQQYLQWCQKQGNAPPASFTQSVQQIEDSLFQQYQREVGSAVAEKGILAVAGACCDASAVGPVHKYLKDWYGYRAAQCKALIAMLSCIDNPSATQFLLSIANRFRTKGIREEAEKYVNILAERKGWTLDELADRTLPTAGFDDDGALRMNFGSRTFVLRATPALEAVLSDADGKTLKALPSPRKDDDEEAAKAAKKAFSAAKAELKKFASLQTTRLYEAMCTQRTWLAADWQTYVLRHPLMRFLCQRLVWAVCDGDAVLATFRPLDDGTLTDHADNDAQLAADAKVRVAHSCHVPPEIASAWCTHLADYSVAPLFTQFGRDSYTLPAATRDDTAINDFEGHMVEAFKLRSLATKAGYTRGQTQDGGWFFDYLKTFPGMRLRVVLQFSGNGLPEENRAVALQNISFQQVSQEESPMLQMSAGMALKEVPAVLLSECYNDLRTIAAAGTGHDPQWEKKVW